MSTAINAGMLFDPLIDSEQDILKIRETAMKLAREGKTTMQWSGEGVESTKQWVMDIENVLIETRIFLKTKNPAKYGYLTNSARQLRF